jgi:copper chaperone CopZ
MNEQRATLDFSVQGMTCAGCVMSVEYALQQLKGVQSVTVDYLRGGRTHIEFEPHQVTQEQVAQALDAAGYTADFSVPVDDPIEQVASSQPGQPLLKRFLSLFLLTLMIAGIATIFYVFSRNQASLPVNLDEVATSDTGTSLTLPVVAVEEYEFTQNSLDWLTDDIAPTNVSASGESMVQIPHSDSELTILLSGLAGCATCGIEAQTLSQLQNEYSTDVVRVVFVDIYHYGGPENLAWFANMLEATNLIWAIDTDGSFKNSYQVDVDSTVIMNREGEILYRDNIVSSYDVLHEQIEIALTQQG